MNRHKKWINDQDFKLVKTLLEAGLSIVKTCEISSRSYATVKMINLSSDLEDYKKRIGEYNLRFKKVEPAKPAEKEAGIDLTGYRLTQIKVLLEKILEKIES